MIEYWSWWNLTWFIGSQMNICNKTNALKTSIIVTSIVGGYMTYVYPRKIIFRIEDKKYQPPYIVMVIGDLFIHQLPLLTIIYIDKRKIENSCGANVLVPFALWGLINHNRKVNVDKLYGIKMFKLVGVSTLLLCGYGLCYHFIQKNQ